MKRQLILKIWLKDDEGIMTIGSYEPRYFCSKEDLMEQIEAEIDALFHNQEKDYAKTMETAATAMCDVS